MPRLPRIRSVLPSAHASIRGAGLVLVVALAVAGCRATTEYGPPQGTPTDMGGIAVALQAKGVMVNDLVSGDAGCPDQTLAKAAITFQASGLDQTTPVTVHLFIFDDDAAYQRARPSVDVCSKSFVTDPATYEAPAMAQLVIHDRHLVWAVAYQPKTQPGGHARADSAFTVYVDDQTGGTEFSGK